MIVQGRVRLGAEQPGQEFPFAALEQDFRQVIEPVEGQVPGPHIGFGRRDAAGGGGVMPGIPASNTASRFTSSGHSAA